MVNKIHFKKYKSFSDGKCYDVKLDSINVIIGRNNTGKSSIIDILEYCTNKDIFINNRSRFEEISISYNIREGDITQVFGKAVSGGIINGNHYSYAEKYIGDVIYSKLDYSKNNNSFNFSLSDMNEISILEGKKGELWRRVVNVHGNPMSNYKVFRVEAERDIVPEEDSSKLIMCPNGKGTTNMINKFINHSRYDSKKVEVELLNALNVIMHPDSLYVDIVVQQIEDTDKIYWEIYLEDSLSNRIPLSKSGSGLKTVIIVLVNLILLPIVKEISLNKIIFAFEELENNLHPALQRNLFKYVSDWVMENHSKVYFTTHSHVAINLFDEIPGANIIHVQKQNGIASLKYVNTVLQKFSIFDDLEVRASDLLQSNGIIWVEGPSDRVYLRKWIDLYSDGMLKENIHYQIMFYGGRLLSHLKLSEVLANSENANNLINLLLLNRNSLIIIDSDKKARNTGINETKQRIKEEYNKYEMFCWITKGKEIENYLNKDIINNALSINIHDDLGMYESIDCYLDKSKNVIGRKFLRNKVMFANKFISNTTLKDFEKNLDIVEKMGRVVEEIKKWNDKV